MATESAAGRGQDRFRIVAAEAHSWSSLLVEDEKGNRYVYAVASRVLTNIGAGTADELVAARAFRPWRGVRSWAPLDQLPVVGQRAAASGVGVGTELGTDRYLEDAQPA